LSSHFDDIDLGKGDIATDAKLLMKVIPESVVVARLYIYVFMNITQSMPLLVDY